MRRWLLAVFLLAFQPVITNAETPYSVRIGASSYKYEEPDLMKIHGTTYEIGTGYRHYLSGRQLPLFFGGELSFTTGTTTYEGSLVNLVTSEKTPKTADSHDQIYQLQGYFGLSFLNTGTQAIEVYGGPAIWALRNKVDGTGSYHREINYFYLQVNGDYILTPSQSYKMIFGAQVSSLVIGTVKSKLSDANSSYPDIDNIQTSGFGYKLRAEFDFPMSGWTPYIEAFYRYWYISDSDVTYVTIGGNDYGFKEPENNTNIFGVNLGARF